MFDDLLQGAHGGCRGHRGEPGREHERTGTIPEPLANDRASCNESALAAERLAEGADEHVGNDLDLGAASAAGRAENAQRMGLVDVERRAVDVAEGAERTEVGPICVHAEVALHHHPGARLGSLLEEARDGIRVVVGGDRDAGAREACPVDEGSMVQRVADDEVARPSQRTEGADIRGVAARERQRVLDAQPRGERALESSVLVTLTGDQARRARSRRCWRRRPRCQAEVVVRAERELVRRSCRRWPTAQAVTLELFELRGEMSQEIRVHVFHVKHPP